MLRQHDVRRGGAEGAEKPCTAGVEDEIRGGRAALVDESGEIRIGGAERRELDEPGVAEIDSRHGHAAGDHGHVHAVSDEMPGEGRGALRMAASQKMLDIEEDRDRPAHDAAVRSAGTGLSAGRMARSVSTAVSKPWSATAELVRAGPHGDAEGLVAQQRGDGVGIGVDLAGRHQQSGLAVAHDLPDAGMSAGDGGQARGGRFEIGHAIGLAVSRPDIDVGRLIAEIEKRPVGLAQKRDPPAGQIPI